jgi:hypothetical protein
VFGRYESDFAKYSTVHWGNEGSNWQGNYYDRSLVYYAFWVRTGNPVYYQRAALIATAYRQGYLVPNGYSASPHWSQLEGLEQHYLLTGDNQSRIAVGRTAERLSSYDRYMGDTVTSWMENRIQARVLMGHLLAWRINAPSPLNMNWASRIDAVLTAILRTQRANGSYGFPVTCDYSLNYMTGMLNDAMIKVHTTYKADARILPSVKRSADYLWTKEWLPLTGSFKYLTQTCSGVGGPYAAPDLNNLIVTSFGWIYKMTGDAAYKTRGDQVFSGAVLHAFLNGSKQFNQQYTESYRYLSYR